LPALGGGLPCRLQVAAASTQRIRLSLEEPCPTARAEEDRMVVLMRLSTVILPIYRWHEQGRGVWRRAEEPGFHSA